MIGENGGNDVSNTVVAVNDSERMMDNWAVNELINWVAGKRGNDET
jgi:hypothetical protein